MKRGKYFKVFNPFDLIFKKNIPLGLNLKK